MVNRMMIRIEELEGQLEKLRHLETSDWHEDLCKESMEAQGSMVEWKCICGLSELLQC